MNWGALIEASADKTVGNHQNGSQKHCLHTYDVIPQHDRANTWKTPTSSNWQHESRILNLLLFAHLCSTNEVYFPKHQDLFFRMCLERRALRPRWKIAAPAQDLTNIIQWILCNGDEDTYHGVIIVFLLGLGSKCEIEIHCWCFFKEPSRF